MPPPLVVIVDDAASVTPALFVEPRPEVARVRPVRAASTGSSPCSTEARGSPGGRFSGRPTCIGDRDFYGLSPVGDGSLLHEYPAVRES